jgi:hypothetical protein
MFAFILAHPLTFGFASFWLFSALVSGMPSPSPGSSFAYHWLFASLNALAANVTDLIRQRYPRAPLPEEEIPADPTQVRLLKMPRPAAPGSPDSA